jgi:hypothetical protein
MKQTLYRLIVPESLREKFYEADARRYQSEQYRRRLRIEEALPQSELSPEFMANLRVLANRDALLNEMPKQATVAELGAGTGYFSYNILLITNPKQLCLIDSWSGDGTSDEAMRIMMGTFPKELTIGQILLDRGTPISQLADYDDGYFDWVYINSEPSYKTTLSLLEVCRIKVNEQGIIAGNNYTTCSYVDQTRYGVIEAVHVFCKMYGWEMVYLTHESHRRLSYALKRIRS